MIPADRIQMGEDEHYTQCSLENQVPRKEVDSKEVNGSEELCSPPRKERVEEFRLQNRETISFEVSFFLADG